MLGARLLVEEGEDGRGGDRDCPIARKHLRVDGRAGATPGPQAPVRAARCYACCEGLPGVDVRIVADPTLREDGGAMKVLNKFN